MKDLIGKALLDYQTNNNPGKLWAATSISDADEMELAHLFRDFGQMPIIEQKAIELARGKVLDVGCGSGSHSLELQRRGLDVTAIDQSENAVKVARMRGVQSVRCEALQQHKGQYDTLLLLMNGTGICGRYDALPAFMQNLRNLLTSNGQVLIDSSDLIYMFDEDPDGGKWIPSGGYYGELEFYVSYKGEEEDPFPWLYLDFTTLSNAAADAGFTSEIVAEGENFDYLARLIRRD